MSPFRSKMERLNNECSNPTLQQNCVAGQKWRCINEDGRWRRHKCKFHLQLQSHLAEINKLSSQNKRNCACFTPDGLIYTKIKSKRDYKHHTLGGRNPGHRSRRQRRDLDEVYAEVFLEANPEMAGLVRVARSVVELEEEIQSSQQGGGRSKREASGGGGGQIESVIHELQSTLKEIERNFEQNSVLNKQNSSAGEDGDLPGTKCFVTAIGKVNCSNVIYEDETSWKRSRMQIDMLIKVLKTKINDLKDIKKHLKEHRPSSFRDEDGDDEEEDNQSASFEQDYELKTTASTTMTSTSTTTSSPSLEQVFQRREPFNRTSFGKRPKHNGGGFRRRPKPARTEDEEGTLIDMTLFEAGGNNEETQPELSNSRSSPNRHRNNGQSLGVNGKHRSRNRLESQSTTPTTTSTASSPDEPTSIELETTASSTTEKTVLEITEEILQSIASSTTVGYQQSSSPFSHFVDIEQKFPSSTSSFSIATEASGFDETPFQVDPTTAETESPSLVDVDTTNPIVLPNSTTTTTTTVANDIFSVNAITHNQIPAVVKHDAALPAAECYCEPEVDGYASGVCCLRRHLNLLIFHVYPPIADLCRTNGTWPGKRAAV